MVEVETIFGPIIGKTEQRFGKDIKAFFGIPFAKPPVGDLRFEYLEDPEKWDSPLETTIPGNICPQNVQNLLSAVKDTTSEDCMYLNVWTPKLKNELTENQKTGLHVLVFVHGGYFRFGSGSHPLYDFSILSSYSNIVCVSFNYRLDVLGFFSIPGSIPFNLGIADQEHALKWVQRNIEFFGGDRNQVTVFGQSAGAASIGYHLMNPEARNLFQRAFLCSGSHISFWAAKKPKKQANDVKRALKNLGCTETDPLEIKSFLKNLPLQDLLKIHQMNDESFKWVPVDVNNTVLKGRFDTPINMPIFIGCTSREGHLFTNLMIQRKNMLKGLPTQVTTVPWKQLCLGDVLTNVVIKNPIKKLADALCLSNDVYAYLFNYNGPTRNSILVENLFPKWSGCSHIYDMFFWLGTVVKYDDEFSAEEVALSKSMMDLINSFVTEGSPSTQWPLYVTATRNYMEISEHKIMHGSAEGTILQPKINFAKINKHLFWPVGAMLSVITQFGISTAIKAK
uniref:Carboxylic ester hydrolase n=1 Tax=Hofstenia miamia TaxID=442651 RepID=A0A7G7LK72_HOFMI|nr:acetylcholinesterase 5 [Hofstenia miamia]